MSEVDLDYNKIAAHIATSVVDDALKAAKDGVSEGIRKSQLIMRQGFGEYVKSSLRRCDRIKTLIDPDRAVSLSSIYVPLDFESSGHRYSDKKVMESVFSERHVLIVGTAGGGKSMFLRRMNLNMLTKFAKVLPIYYELRGLNSSKAKSLLEAVYLSVKHHIKALKQDEFELRVQSGSFALILDGFDEIDHDNRVKYTDEINALIDHYDGAIVVITTRPEEHITSLHAFVSFHAQPMTKSQTTELLSKIDYDSDVKEIFISRVRSDLYDRHKDFLSIPLLTSMMLLTFSQYSDIPDKIHIFYQQAFEVLVQRHDRSKGAFTRKSYSGLAMDDFQRLFSYFCASSYAAEKFSFTSQSILEFIAGAIRFESLSAKPELVLKDFTESTCLLQPDGLEYAFAHRSFQEYFTAIFISKLDEKEMVSAINSIIKRTISDSVVAMLFDINRDSVERNWSAPTVRSLIHRLRVVDLKTSASDFLKIMFSNIAIRHDHLGILLDQRKSYGMKLYALSRLYGAEFRVGLGPVNKDGYKALLALLKRDPASCAAIEKHFPVAELTEKLGAGKTFSLHFPLSSLNQPLSDALGITEWAKVELDILVKLQKDLSQRLSAKKQTLKLVFSR